MNIEISIKDSRRDKTAHTEIVDLLTQARDLAQRSNLKFLDYLIQMSLIEARSQTPAYQDNEASR